MKKLLFNTGLLAVIALACSCNHTNSVNINGQLINPGAIKTVYLLAADSSAINVVDSTSLSEDGKFRFNHQSPYANLFKLRTGSFVFDLIAKNGDDIIFKTDMADKTHAYDVSGSEESVKVRELNKVVDSYGAKTEKIAAEYQQKSEQIGHESDSLMRVYRPMFMAAQAGADKAVYQFALNNKTSLAGFYAALMLDPARYEQQLVAYADAIGASLSYNPAVRKFVAQMAAAKPLSIGHKAPEFSMPGLNGKSVTLADYKGKYVMLDFWASWCGPCRQEMPNVVKQYNNFKGKGFNILGISLDESKEPWQMAVKMMEMSWQQASELQKWDGATERLYHIQAIPANYVINPQGVIVAKNLVGPDLEMFLNKTFKSGK